MIDEARIFQWLENVEGKMTCRGYIPCHKNSAALRDRNGWGGEYVSRRFQEGTLLMEVC